VDVHRLLRVLQRSVFCSRRRRHTRSQRDWSSDVCSSDLERPRIFTEANAEGYSFPSGHAMISLVCYGLFTYFITEKISSKKLKLCVNLASAILIFIIGMSRFIINVHYLTDVLTGFMFVFIMVIVIIYIHYFVVRRCL